MTEKNKKLIIALLLLLSCIVSTFILIETESANSRRLNSFARADSLLQSNLGKFNISSDQVRVQTIQVDSTFSRKNYRIAVPPGFSKTQLHAELHKTFHPLEVESPAEVLFPNKDFRIHLLYRNTVFRSIFLTTDPELQLDRSFGSIVIAFRNIPSDKRIEQIISLGEPVSIALIVENPLEANELKTTLEDQYSEIIFWLQDENGNNITAMEPSRALPKLRNLQEAVSGARVLSFTAPEELSNRILSDLNLQFIDASQSVLLDANLGRPAFIQELNKFQKQTQNYEHGLAVVMGSSQAINWLREELSDFKKSGLRITTPQNLIYQFHD